MTGLDVVADAGETAGQANPYDALTYRGHAFPQTLPRRLATIAHAHGLQPAASGQARVLELGCGSGGNLLPLAFASPGGRFVGIDLSASAIAEAKRRAGQLGLVNIEFIHRDIMEIAPTLGEFDYIIAHGVYSWVPDPVRDHILRIYGSMLAPHGVAYVSYNALPGCRMRDMARDVMLFAIRGIAEPAAQIRQARVALKTVAQATDPKSFYGAGLRARSEQIDALSDDVLYHDDLNPIARAFSLTEVVAAAEGHGLQYLGDESFPNRFEAVRGQARDIMANIAPEPPVLRQQALDLIVGRFFRQTLFCRAGLVLSRAEDELSLDAYHLAADVSEVPDDPGAASAGAVAFAFADGVKLMIDLPVAQAALRKLAACWPATVAHGELVALALAEAGVAPGPDSARETARLGEALTAMFRADLLEIHLDPPALSVTPGERPVASAYARWQAMSGREVTDLRHRTVALDDDLVRHFIMLLDGTRDAAALQAAMNAYLETAPRPAGDAPPLPHSVTPEDIASHLRSLVRFGLLCG
jgi:SAM-dependent methyltransferase